MDIQYVTNEAGERIAVQIPLEQWEIIKAELESYGSDDETGEVTADDELMKSVEKGRNQARQRIGRHIEEIDV